MASRRWGAMSHGMQVDLISSRSGEVAIWYLSTSQQLLSLSSQIGSRTKITLHILFQPGVESFADRRPELEEMQQSDDRTMMIE